MTEKGLLWNRFGFKSGMKCSTIYRNPLNARNGLSRQLRTVGLFVAGARIGYAKEKWTIG